MISAFFIRLENFANAQVRSIDEVVYFRIGYQLTKDLSHYNTIPYGQELAATGRELPPYFFQPLFKHPPLFSYLLSLSMWIFGTSYIAAAYVPLAFGVLLIPLCYILGCMIYNRKIGLLSAVLMWMDPISIICSQKVWMSTSLAFFMLLSLIYFINGLTKENSKYFIYSGIACGLAFMTKYAGILPAIVYFLYAKIYQPQLFRERKFIGGLIVPFIFFIPWAVWNAKVYGMSKFFDVFLMLYPHIFKRMDAIKPYVLLLFLVLFVVLYVAVKKIRQADTNQNQEKNFLWMKNIRGYFPTILFILFIVVVAKSFVNSFSFGNMPGTSWGNFGFRGGHWVLFYFVQLLKFSH